MPVAYRLSFPPQVPALYEVTVVGDFVPSGSENRPAIGHQPPEAFITEIHLQIFHVTDERHVQRRYVRGFSGRPGRYEQNVSYLLRLACALDAIGQQRLRMGWRLYATNAPVSVLSLKGAVQLNHASPRIERDFIRLKGKQLGIRPLYVQREDHLIGVLVALVQQRG